MNENIDLTKILENCPTGTKLYTPVWGEVTFNEVEDKDYVYPICIYTNTCTKVQLTKMAVLLVVQIQNVYYSHQKTKEIGVSLQLLGTRRKSLTLIHCSRLIRCW